MNPWIKAIEPVGFTAADAALAACRAAQERFDVLVVGHLGSTKSSLELAAALHKAAPHLPIALATKSTEEIDADRLMFARIADVVHWPIVAAEIAAALNRCSQLTGPEAKPPPNSSRGAYCRRIEPIAVEAGAPSPTPARGPFLLAHRGTLPLI